MELGLIGQEGNRNRVGTAREFLILLDTELQLGTVVVRRFPTGTKFLVSICVVLLFLKGTSAPWGM